ncbi:MAG: hypothetical protein WCV90_00725 [Candidatus Woesearchaeota archaeon]|jgi:hypothetical protein
MNAKIKEGLEALMGYVVTLGMIMGSGALFYQGCVRKTTLEDVTITAEDTLWSRDYETGIDFYTNEIKLDKYDDWLRVDNDDDLSKGERFETLTYRNNFWFGPKVVDYTRK